MTRIVPSQTQTFSQLKLALTIDIGESNSDVKKISVMTCPPLSITMTLTVVNFNLVKAP